MKLCKLASGSSGKLQNLAYLCLSQRPVAYAWYLLLSLEREMKDGELADIHHRVASTEVSPMKHTVVPSIEALCSAVDLACAAVNRRNGRGCVGLEKNRF